MLQATVQRASAGVVVGLSLLFFLGVGPARADGPCGHDFDGPTACPITTSGTVGGSLAMSKENDYYVFYAEPRTQLTLVITDTESPTCGMPLDPNYHQCSLVLVKLFNARGRFIKQSYYSEPHNGVPVPMVLSRRLHAGGIYYAVVTGVLGSAGPIPYSLGVEGSPNVQYPPPCTVPRLRRDTSLARAKGVVALHHCSVGMVTRARDRRVRRGDVVGLRPRAGTVAPSGAPIGIIVSSGPNAKNRPKRSRHRRR